VLSGGFALGILIISMSGGLSVSINSYLFGSIITVTDTGVGIIAVLGLVVVSVIALTHKQLLYLTFDEEGARVARINVSMYERMLIVLSALVVVGAMQILGVILVAAMLVVPVAAASQLARSFRQSIVLSIIAGELSVVAGIALSYLYNFPTGATIVLVAVLVYVILVMSKSINLR
ncbi:MAG: metal ABC transporter permease, partial [Halobacteria archaeon]|nr:metal ABC transporter permease [Halobacteria archaeon]